jgi:hypothetical protein
VKSPEAVHGIPGPRSPVRQEGSTRQIGEYVTP